MLRASRYDGHLLNKGVTAERGSYGTLNGHNKRQSATMLESANESRGKTRRAGRLPFPACGPAASDSCTATTTSCSPQLKLLNFSDTL